jgi:porin
MLAKSPVGVGLCATLVMCQPANANEAPGAAEQMRQGHTHMASEVAADEPPLLIDVTYSADIWQAADGGVSTGTRYLDNLDIVAEADMERLVGWNGASIGAYVLYNNGASLSELMGDGQVASNIETGVQALRLYEAWIDQQIGEQVSVRLGLYDLNSEFDALDSSSLFIGSAHGIGTDISQSGENGPSIFPSTSMAARLALSPAAGWTVRAAVLDGIPGDPAHPRRTAITLGNGDGALLIGEIEAPLPAGKLLFGYWRYTAQADDLLAQRQRNNSGFYFRGETSIFSEGVDRSQRLTAFFRLGLANRNVNQFTRFASAGLNYTGLIEGRGTDQLGLAVASALTSAEYRLTTPSTKDETVLELTYRALLANWLTIQPNLQYVFNPGTDPTRNNAMAVGLRTEVAIQFR